MSKICISGLVELGIYNGCTESGETIKILLVGDSHTYDYKTSSKNIITAEDFISKELGDNYRTATMPTLEADDVMGIKSNSTTMIISDDKDMKTIPTKIYRPMSNEFLDISQQEADKNFLTQALTGDSTDGYKGLSGVGIKKAEAILGSRPHWGAVEDAYLKAGYAIRNPFATTVILHNLVTDSVNKRNSDNIPEGPRVRHGGKPFLCVKEAFDLVDPEIKTDSVFNDEMIPNVAAVPELSESGLPGAV